MTFIHAGVVDERIGLKGSPIVQNCAYSQLPYKLQALTDFIIDSDLCRCTSEMNKMSKIVFMAIPPYTLGIVTVLIYASRTIQFHFLAYKYTVSALSYVCMYGCMDVWMYTKQHLL